MYPTKNIRMPNGVRVEQERTPVLHDHFLWGAGAVNSYVPQPFVTTEAGSGTIWVTNATAGSYLVGVTGATTNNAQEIAGKKVGWNPSTMGGIFMEVRLKTIGATEPLDGDCCIGFNDAVTESNALAYVVGADSALTTHAPTNHASFYYSSIPTEGALFAEGGNPWGFITSKADVDTVTAPTTAVIKSSVFRIFRLEIDASGNATYYIDDNFVGRVALAVTANTEFTPYVAHVAKASHAVTTSIDWITVGAGSYV
jgi:hypothetical protein